jgi:hypothetical protein
MDGRWSQGPGELTPLGMRQHYLIGYELRNRYVIQSQVLSENFTATEIYVRSTDVNRTLQSAYSQLQGLYPEGTGPSLSELSLQATAVPPIRVTNLTNIQDELGQAALPSFLQPEPVHTVSNNHDLLLLPEDNCRYAKQLMYSTINDSAEAAYYAQYPALMQTIQNYYGIDYHAATKAFDALYDSITANTFSGYPVPSVFSTSSFLSQSQALHAQLFKLKYGGQPDIVGQMLASEFMILLRESLTEASSNQTSVKFLFLSAHDSTLQGFLNGLQLNTTAFPVYASTLFTELHLLDAKYYVRMLFNDVPVVVPACSQAMCPLDTFLGYLNNRIIPDIQQFCDSTHSTDLTTSSATVSVIAFGSLVVLAGIGVVAVLLSQRRKQKPVTRYYEV